MRKVGYVAAAVLAASAVLAVPSPASATTPTVAPSTIDVRFHLVTSALSSPLFVTAAGDGSHRLFVVEQGGQVRVVLHGQLQQRVYLDLSSKLTHAGAEQGLLSMVFHPDFRQHPFVYAAYTRASDGALQVSRFRASSAAATRVASGTEQHLLTVPHPQQQNHNGGQLMFGRGGLFYIGTGDGGGAGDPFGNAEDLTSLSGKLLRIDVDKQCGKHHYCIPSTNPFANSSTKARQIFDWGLRNPWRMSIDRAGGRLWIGDVGQDSREEIDHVATKGGKDFGWSCREGNASYNSGRCTVNGQPRHMTGPVHVYVHNNGRCAVIGGYAYRGPDYPFAHGLYVYGDYCTAEVWALGRTRSGGYPSAKVGDVGSSLTGFGESDSGEIYAVDAGGHLYHLVFQRRA